MESGTTDHHHQDFSFPVINDTTTSYAIDSPPLWCSSPSAAAPYSISCREQEASTKLTSGEEESDEDGDYKDFFTIAEESLMMKSCNSATGREREKRIPFIVAIELDEKEKEKERMDMLWEDFNNDELFKRNSSTSRLMDVDHDVVSIGCVEALRFSKPPTATTGSCSGGGSGAIYSARKASFLVFIKVLKKLFMLHNSHHRSVVKPPSTCHRQHRAVQTKSRRILI